jgi:cytochrome c biogenesis protein CcdA/thiol-disulfide isomerase/thioredoxin
VVILLGIAFLAGVITAISPCVLPVLPIILAGGASGGNRRPYAIVAGLVTTFVVSILFASYLLQKLGLPDDLLRNLAIALLFVVAATLLFPRLAMLLERALAPLSRRTTSDLGGGFLLGCALGFAFVPCGGPILGYVSAQSATLDFGFKTVALAIAYAAGASTVLLAIAVGGQRVAQPLRGRVSDLRRALGVVIAVAAVALVFNLDTKLQTALPNWTGFLQRHTENTAFARDKLYEPRAAPVHTRGGFTDYGVAPDFQKIDAWVNSPPLTMQKLRGKVVLIDFWTYSCINCLRTLPHLKAWYARYHREGLEIVGVHTPEFAFEHSLSNVRSACKRLGVTYPVALDNDYGTWNAYANQYWPAEYLVDRRGHIRRVHFGEGEYGEAETAIRNLLGERLGPMTRVADDTPRELTSPESYLGYDRLTRFLGTPVHVDQPWRYYFSPSLPQNNLSYGGTWTIRKERAVAGAGARLRYHFHAKNVYLVLSGSGRVDVLVDGRKERVVRVDGDRLYTLVSSPRVRDAILELHFTPGVAGYAFTFG